MMIKDKIYFLSGILAFVKGCTYLLAFLTTVLFINSTGRTYIFGIIVYSCGCICDYIETAAQKDKNPLLRKISAGLAMLTGILITVALSMANSYDSCPAIKIFLDNNHFWVDLFLVIFWVIPLGNGCWTIMKSIQSDKDKVQNVSSFFIKP